MSQLKKILIIITALGLLMGLVGFRSKTANAAAVIYDPLEMLKEFIIKPLVRKIANSLENKLMNKVNNTVSNIDGKSPAFITNWRNHLLDSQARGNDVFRSVLADAKLCGYFNQNLKTAFGADKFAGAIKGAKVTDSSGKVVYENKTNIPGLPSFQTSANCTLPSNFNANTFKNDFAKGGGWDTWNKLIQPQNNFFGVYAMALGEQSKQMDTEEKTAMNSAVAGQGFLSQKLGIGTSGIGPSGCANSTIGGCMLYTEKSACESNKCTWNGGDINTPPTCGGGETVSRCTFMGKEVTPAQILGKSAASTLDTKLKKVGGSTELTDILLSLFATVLNGVTDKLTNYIGQATYDRPPSAGTGFDESGVPTTNPNFDAQVNQMRQAGYFDSCITSCIQQANCNNQPGVAAQQKCLDDAKTKCNAQCSSI